jgi:OFA family oxalate/formate antiporter-like MFS transporter
MRTPTQKAADPGVGRWRKLVACIAAMMAIANLQYAWTLFTTPLTESLQATLAAVQWAFTFFVLTQTWLVPFNAYLIDRFGARIIVSAASLLVGTGWVGAGLATSLTELWVAYAIGGVGAGAVYSASISVAMKWFPDRRGLCVGAVAGSYGFGTALTVLPIARMIDAGGYASAFIIWGVIQGVVVLAAAQFLSLPPEGWVPAGWAEIKAKIQNKVQQSSRDYTPGEMLKTAPFYILYVMMTMVAFGGLMVTAQVKPIGTTYGFDKQILFSAVSVLSLALLMERVLNGLARPFWGWISDHIGRYHTMALAFFLEGLAITALALLVAEPIWFIIFSSLTFLAWGEIYSLFPAAIADIFGSKYATTNYGIQYTSKGVASMLAGPGAALLMAATGSWMPVLWTAVACDLVAAALAVFWLKPLVTRLVNQQAAEPAEQEIAAKTVAAS